MSFDWKTFTVGELTINHDAKRIPVKEADRKSGEYPYYGASGIVDWVDQYIFDGEFLLVAEDGENLRSRKTPVAFMAKGKFWVNNHAHIIQGNEKADTRFLSYLLEGRDISGYLTGSTIPKLSQRNLNAIELEVPEVREQKAIAHILGTLDDKIELNRKTNETLEAMAKALFKSWFVDFDPVRAKAEGLSTGLPAEISDLFPDSFEDSELGEIPSGWETKKIGEVITRLPVGKRFDQKTVLPSGSTPVLDQSAGGIVGFHNEEAGIAATRDAPLFTFANHTCAMRYMIRPFSVIQNVFPLSGNGVDTAWLYQASRGKQEITEYKGHYPDFVEKQIVVPSNNVDRIYGSDYHGILLKCDSNLLEATFLASVRDALLPKLISGEIRIPDAEKMLEEVGV